MKDLQKKKVALDVTVFEYTSAVTKRGKKNIYSRDFQEAVSEMQIPKQYYVHLHCKKKLGAVQRAMCTSTVETCTSTLFQ